jgi:coenzyme F420-0:L-glutamate ligase/coenzyme F420-1:gamma-L-glutamate ligase
LAADSGFWGALDRLFEIHPVVIDRPKGTSHPRYPETGYPLDHGYLSGTRSADGGGLDVWIGTLQPPRVTGLALTLDLHKREAELMVMLGCTLDEMRMAKAFMEQGEMHAMLLPRGADELDWLRLRRSVRRFTSQPVPEDVLERVLESASWAPSPHNSQPWRFVVLRSAQSRHDMTASLGLEFLKDLLASDVKPDDARVQVERSGRRIQEAPVAIVLCLDESVLEHHVLESRQAGERLMAVQSVAMAGQNLLLAAHLSGLGGVWLCAPLFAPQAVRRALGLPESWQPQGMILLGYPATQPPAGERLPIDSLTIYR